MEINDTNELIRKRVDAFYRLQKKVHISLRLGNWKRGIILEVLDSSLVLDECLEGKIPIFFEEILKIDGYVERGWK